MLRWLVRATLGIYAGWSTAAVFVNIATLVSGAGVRTDDVPGTAWQAAFLVLAGVAALVILRRLGAPLPYAATVVWAFVGVIVSAVMAGLPGLAVVALAGMAGVVAETLIVRRRGVLPA